MGEDRSGFSVGSEAFLGALLVVTVGHPSFSFEGDNQRRMRGLNPGSPKIRKGDNQRRMRGFGLQVITKIGEAGIRARDLDDDNTITR